MNNHQFNYNPDIPPYSTHFYPPEKVYDIAHEVFKKASAGFRAIRLDYRQGKINDSVFLAARAEFDKAQEVFDRAEITFINACKDSF
jgi:hypothetical protein